MDYPGNSVALCGTAQNCPEQSDLLMSTSCLDVVIMPLTVWWRSWRSCHRHVAGCTDVIVIVVVDAIMPLAHGCSGGCRGCRHCEGGGTAFDTIVLPVAQQL